MHWKFSWEYEAIYLVAMSQLKKKIHRGKARSQL